MARPCGLSVAKGFLIAFNFIFLLCGCAVLGLGVWMRFDKEVFTTLHLVHVASAGPVADRMAYIMMGIGGAITLLCFLGCCGAWTESVCCLFLYTVPLILIILGEIVLGILIAIFRNKIGTGMQDVMKKQLRTEYNATAKSNVTDPLTIAWNAMQIGLDCCGSEGPQDYLFSAWFNHTRDDEGDFVPPHCCVLAIKNITFPKPVNENQCQRDAFRYPRKIKYSDTLKTRGCSEPLLESIEPYMWYFIGPVIGIFVLQLLDTIMSCLLMNWIRKEQAKYPWYLDDD